MCSHSAIPILLALTLSTLPAQSTGSPQPLFDWCLPIHQSAGELWATGPSYKARFGRTFSFVPVRGSDAEGVTWTWSTTSIRAGDRVLVGPNGNSTERRSAWRYERAYSNTGVTEVYEVRKDGVEQLFLLEHVPAGAAGDLVVTGRISMVGGPGDAGGLLFFDQRGEPAVSYGAAVAFDALGDRAAVRSELRGQELALRLDGDWLARAAFPIVIDPLVTTTNYPGGAPDTVDIASSADGRLLLTTTRAISATDWDLAAVEVDEMMVPIATAFTDISSTWATRNAQSAFAHDEGSNPDHWVCATQRVATGSTIWITTQAVGAPLNTGTWHRMDHQAGTRQIHPTISGGHSTGRLLREAVVVFQEEGANLSQTSIKAVGFDWVSGIVSPPSVVASGGLTDNEFPSITRSFSTDSPVVAYQTRMNRAGSSWDVAIAVLNRDGSPRSSLALATGAEHELRPVIAGEGGRYAVAFTMQDIVPVVPTPAGTGHAIDAQRVDIDSAANVTPGIRDEIATAVRGRVSTSRARGIGFDTGTCSHWAVGYTIDARLVGGVRDAAMVRIGFTCGVTESAVLEASLTSDAFSPSVCFNPNRREFPVAWPTDVVAPLSFVYARGNRMYYSVAPVVPFGTSCAGTLDGVNRTSAYPFPIAGSEFYSMRLLGALPSATTVLLIGADASLNLQISPGCFFNVGPVPLIFSVGTTNSSGDYSVQVSLPDAPLFLGALYWQAIQVNPSGQLLTSNGFAFEVK